MSALGEAPAETGRLEWQEKDGFVVPSWYWHAHSNERAEPATLFSPSDDII
jgi:gentisate 1,2-dioxygenase